MSPKPRNLLVAVLSLVAPLAQAAASEGRPSQLTLQTLDGPVIADRVLDGIVEPVAIEFLPDGRAIVLQRKIGVITLADFGTGEKTDITGLPPLIVKEAAGVHDVELHPDFTENGWIYVAYSEGEEHRSTAVLDRFRIDGARMTERERIFSADAYSEGLYHFAARIAFVDDFVFLALGDREHPPMAQDLANHAGAVVRLHDDGRVPDDNPFVGSDPVGNVQPRPEIWSYGHRDPQGLYTHPETGELWLHEHGPRGGDELNLVRKGANYGWPVISFGFEYDGGPIGMGLPMKDGMEVPRWVYVPSIAPSDMVIYDGDAFPAWRGNFLIGAMAGLHLNRLVPRDGEIVAEERIGRFVMGRIRSVAVDAEGLVYLGSDTGEVWRLRPAAPAEGANLMGATQ